MARHRVVSVLAISGLLTGLVPLGFEHYRSVVARADLAAAQSREVEVEECRIRGMDRSTATTRVINRLGTGRLTLAEAAAELDTLYADCHDFRAGLRATFPGATDRERFARMAATRTVRQAYHDAVRQAAIARRLDTEFGIQYPTADPADLPSTAVARR